MNVLTVLPDFDIKPYTHIIPSLEKALLTTADLLTLDALDVAKRAQIPSGEVKKLVNSLLEGLHACVEDADKSPTKDDIGGWRKATTRLNGNQAGFGLQTFISTLDDHLDAAFGGGIASGYLTEFVGESAVGKTQFLLTLLLSVQLQTAHGPGKSALYISTEAPLQTTRLNQLLLSHPKLSGLPKSEQPSLARVQSTHIHDVEAQEHILRYQVPVAIRKQNIGLLVIDSIAANYRAEFDRSKAGKGAASFAQRSDQLNQMGALLREIARMNNIAVVVANQVADRFTAVEASSQALRYSQKSQHSRPNSPTHPNHVQTTAMSQVVPSDTPAHDSLLSTDDPLALDHQLRFITGWGDDPATTNFKTPSLGLTWTNQLATRIALLKEPVYGDLAYAPGEDREISEWRRAAKVVFNAWSAESKVGFQIQEGGLQGTTESDAISA